VSADIFHKKVPILRNKCKQARKVLQLIKILYAVSNKNFNLYQSTVQYTNIILIKL